MRAAATDMTTGSEARHVIRFALPLLAGNLLQQVYNVADTAIVGKKLGHFSQSARLVGQKYGYLSNACHNFFLRLNLAVIDNVLRLAFKPRKRARFDQGDANAETDETVEARLESCFKTVDIGDLVAEELLRHLDLNFHRVMVALSVDIDHVIR